MIALDVFTVDQCKEMTCFLEVNLVSDAEKEHNVSVTRALNSY